VITTAREYQITRAQLERLSESVDASNRDPPPRDVHPTILASELAAIAAQIEILTAEIKAYDDLVSGRTVRFGSTGLKNLPEVLIQARIANRWSQKQLADRLDVHEQQVQRYEATRYRGVSFDRLVHIAKMLGVEVEQTAILAAPAVRKARGYLHNLGLPQDFLSRRVISLSDQDDPEDVSGSGATLERLCHIFGWRADQLAGSRPPRIPTEATGGAVFKLPAGRNASVLEAYTAYAYHLALGAARCADHLPRKSIPSDWEETRRQLLAGGNLTLSRIIDWAWDMGIVLFYLSDPSAFHAAFWRIEGRNVIILKQKTASADRLMHDALHEIFHASQQPERQSRAILDDEDYLHSRNQEEASASTFASDVLLNGRATDLVKEVAQEAGSQGPALKAATMRVAQHAGVPLGALANHLAWVLERQTQPLSWWSVAHNLQESAQPAIEYARQRAFQNLTPPIGDDIDVDLLFRALRDEGFR
jgi:transcriptional regulator with XRE-family HTH domain/Zn-dependent peptidase ImmA (M78 family)